MDIENTKHFTTNSDIILKNIIDYVPYNIDIVEPFVGNGDLLPYIEPRSSNIEMYDIDSTIGIKRDTLMCPPQYFNKWVITNPPYLARNKSKDKSIYDHYNMDDLYKIAIKTLINGDVNGGILIIPINFLTDENTEELRKQFFEKYSIKHINYFLYKIFEKTSYSICSFYFDKNKYATTTIDIYDVNGLKDTLSTKLSGRLFNEFYESITAKPIVSRVVENNVKNSTNIKVYCIDNKNSFIRAEYDKEIFVGKNTDRAFFTLTNPENMILSENRQREIVNIFNKFINDNRNKYYNLIFTNYRENNRKRIGFDVAYSIMTKIINGEIK